MHMAQCHITSPSPAQQVPTVPGCPGRGMLKLKERGQSREELNIRMVIYSS